MSASESSARVNKERQATVTRALESWISKLIDLSRRNRLLYFRELKTGTLDLTDADTNAIKEFLKGQSVLLTRLLPNADETIILARAQEVRRVALANREEKGLDTLFVAFGFATWPVADDGRPAESPVLLVPVVLEKRGRDGRTIALKLGGECQINPVLLFVLEDEHGLKISPESILQSDEQTEREEAVDPTVVYSKLSAAASRLKEFRISHRVVLGNFSFHKMAMVKDLRENPEALASHDLVASLAGDPEAKNSLRQAEQEVNPRELDQIPPENEFLVLDADSSQQAAISAVLRNQSGVIIGPPGTGKSQTIANVIAELAARGRRVLFVAEKRVALEVVINRLREVGLSHLALDLHGAGISRREVMQRFSESLELVRESLPIDTSFAQQIFVDRRKRLNQHVERLHAARPPSGLNAYQMQGRLLRFKHAEHSQVRWRGADLDRLSDQVAQEVRDLLVELTGFKELFFGEDPSPWRRAHLSDGQTAERAFDAATRLASETWPSLQRRITAVVTETGLRAPATTHELKSLLGLLHGVNETVQTFDPAIFRQDLDLLTTRLTPSQSPLRSILAWCFRASYRTARKTIRSLHRGPKRPTVSLCQEAARAAAQLRRWKDLSTTSSYPAESVHADQCKHLLDGALADIGELTSVLQTDLTRLNLIQLAKAFGELASDSVTPQKMPRLLEIERRIVELGAGGILKEIRQRHPEPTLWPDLFDHAWLSSCLDRARAGDPSLGGFNGRVHEQFAEKFCILDRERMRLAAARVRRAHAERAIAAMNAQVAQADLVRREANKKARHMPLRRLLAAAPEVLTALRPCWMASPLSVSELIPVGRQYFDFVLFDEASQVLPEDAVPAILRATNGVVAGDQHQLPPTTFFATGEELEEEEESESLTAGFESVLEQMLGFINPWLLEWHYRSRDEALIAFSNRHIYSDRLVTFPGVGGPPSISHVLVPFKPGQDGQEESSSEEVRKVVELVLKHASERPNETLGVIAMGIKHAQRVEAAFEEALKSRPDLEQFFDESRGERFFVKNLERVQGDERDAIILTIGYGKDRTGRLLYRFGPLLTSGGERRLNVAITRARRRMTVVSSFDHHDMDPNRSRARGVELLRLYLEYAASKGQHLGDRGPLPFALNTLEADIYDALKARDIPLIPQYGASKYRIDIVAQHPKRPGRLVLAIECDGASYHSAPTARDRDRLRQQHLEALGFRFHRIWSTDWFMRRDVEIARAITAFRAAVEYADRIDSSGGSHDVNGSTPRSNSDSSSGLEASSRTRGPRPKIPNKRNIGEYTIPDLITWIDWIESDGRLRTDEEIIEEMVRLLFHRRGNRIEAAVRQAVRLWKGPRELSPLRT